MSQTDLLGRELDATDSELLALYEQLKGLSEREDLPPCALHNVRHAAAALWQVVNDLNLDWTQPYESGL